MSSLLDDELVTNVAHYQPPTCRNLNRLAAVLLRLSFFPNQHIKNARNCGRFFEFRHVH